MQSHAQWASHYAKFWKTCSNSILGKTDREQNYESEENPLVICSCLLFFWFLTASHSAWELSFLANSLNGRKKQNWSWLLDHNTMRGWNVISVLLDCLAVLCSCFHSLPILMDPIAPWQTSLFSPQLYLSEYSIK